jgi:hypothetical protein
MADTQCVANVIRGFFVSEDSDPQKDLALTDARRLKPRASTGQSTALETTT